MQILVEQTEIGAEPLRELLHGRLLHRRRCTGGRQHRRDQFTRDLEAFGEGRRLSSRQIPPAISTTSSSANTMVR